MLNDNNITFRILVICSLIAASQFVMAADDKTEVKALHNQLQDLQSANQQLERRVKDLESSTAQREDAIRAIIQDAVSSRGSNINDVVSLGGTLEMISENKRSDQGDAEHSLGLNTVELDFEIQTNQWVTGGFVIEYDDGSSQSLTSNADEITRFNLDTAFITLGDITQFPVEFTTGRLVLPFGTSTGDPVADVLSIEDPLTIGVFETRAPAIGINIGWPTPKRKEILAVEAPPVRPRLFNPGVSWLARAIGYKPYNDRKIHTVSPSEPKPAFHFGAFYFDGSTKDNSPDQTSLTFGYQTKSQCGMLYQDLSKAGVFCPWSVDIDIDFISSVFDSQFLGREYANFLDQIGLIPGMSASMKLSFGPVSITGEWNSALKETNFIDDSNTSITIKPTTWQISIGSQIDWNPWQETIGEKGTYLSLSYSKSKDLAGVNLLVDTQLERVGFVPKQQLLFTVGEWVLEGVNVAVEYAYAKDYTPKLGGTSNTTRSLYSTLTYVW